MFLKMSAEGKNLHEEAVRLSRAHRKIECRLVEVLQQISELKVYRCLGRTSLFQYITDELGYCRSVAYGFDAVVRKAAAVPELLAALQDNQLSIHKAVRLISVLTPENGADLIEFAKGSTREEIDRKVASLNPRKSKRAHVRIVTEDTARLGVDLSTQALANLQRVRELLPQKQPVTESEAIAMIADAWLERNDPVRKAKRSIEKAEKKAIAAAASENVVVETATHVPEENERQEFRPDRNSVVMSAPSRKEFSRRPLTAMQEHEVYARDQGQCTFVTHDGKRCPNRRHLHTHHIVLVSKGGSNEPENLTLLCSSHHALVHQQSFPLDGQVSWLREPQRAYCA